MFAARSLLIALICTTPAILLIDGGLVHGLLAAVVAAALAIVALTMRPGEFAHLTSIGRPLLITALVPALWMIIQIIPLKPLGLAHPIWDSAESALGISLSGTISIDPGATLMALGQYLTMLAVAVVAAAVAVDRQRAEWLLFSLVVAATVIAIIFASHSLGLRWPATGGDQAVWPQAQACIVVGVFASAAALIRAFERYETARLQAARPVPALARSLLPSAVCCAICLAALASELSGPLAFALAFGFAILIAIIAIRRFGIGSWGIAGLAGVGLLVAIVWFAYDPGHSGDFALAVTKGGTATVPITARILADAPWGGTGAGTFSALIPIYRDLTEARVTAGTSSAVIVAIELGRPMLWLIVLAVIAAIVGLSRGALQRGQGFVLSRSRRRQSSCSVVTQFPTLRTLR